jgi:hypothetical protein
VLALCFEACWFGELSQQPIRPHSAHLRRCSHQPPVAKQSTQPVPVGFAFGLIPSLKLHGLSFLNCTQTDCCSIYLCGRIIRQNNKQTISTSCRTAYLRFLHVGKLNGFALLIIQPITLKASISNDRVTTTIIMLSSMTFFTV